MSVFMLIFLVLLLYVSYCKLVCLVFRGRQHNRFFAAFFSTALPVVGSIPTYIMAAKYERRVGGVAPKMNDDVLRYVIIALQLVSVFMLFCPFYKLEDVGIKGINLIYGSGASGSEVINPTIFFSYFVIAPFVSAVVNSVDRKYNIRNVLTYATSLIICLSITLYSLFLSTGDIVVNQIVWIFCIVHVIIMLLSVFSLIKVRNDFLAKLELREKEEYIAEQKKRNRRKEPAKPAENMYKCAKCGEFVEKGKLCECRANKLDSLDKVIAAQNEKETSDFCVYCRRALKPGETCKCVGDGFGITVKPEQFEGRKCKYCGQVLVGDSVCVCEKIMRNSAPAAPVEESENKPVNKSSAEAVGFKIADELESLEQKIDQKFTEVKSTLDNSEPNTDE